MDLYSQKTEITWENLNLAFNTKTETKLLLAGMNGKVGPSTMTALLGPSGAGKTTVMNAIAGRLPFSLKLEGEILLNSRPRDKSLWPKQISYVEQEFYAYEHQSVLETMEFASRIKLGHSNVKRIDEVLNLLGLSKARHTHVINLSGGERKRLSIGVELLGNPPILFLDEPTSGLDSFNALNILSLLKDLTKYNKTILMTIHQPSYQMLRFFDDIIIVSLGGVAFQGEIDACISFFDRCGYPLPLRTNPTDFFLDIVSLDTRNEEVEMQSLNDINRIKDEWNRCRPTIEHKLTEEVGSSFTSIPLNYSLLLLLTRKIVNYSRNTAYLKVKLAQKVVILLLFGLTYLQLGYSEEAITSRVGVLTFILINNLFGVCGPIFNIFPLEKKIIQRERRSGLYSGFNAFASQYIAEIPFTFCFDITYVAIIYWMIGLNSNAGRFFVYMIIIASVILFSTSFALTVSTISPSANVAQVIGTTIIIVYVIYGSGFANPNTIPSWLRWLIWISPVYYAFKATLQNQLSDVTFGATSGESVISMYGMTGTGVWPCILAVWGFIGLYIIVGSFCLHYTTRPNINIGESRKPVT